MALFSLKSMGVRVTGSTDMMPAVAMTVNLIGNATIDDKENLANDGCSAGKWSFVTADENTVRCVFLLFKGACLSTYDPQNATTIE